INELAGSTELSVLDQDIWNDTVLMIQEVK
ncbi:hypothetical protein X975_23120, partial [Stegodyphus mimosarum]